MVDVSRTFTVRQPREVIVAYLRDFSHTEEWDPGTVECTQEDNAPIALGTRWHNKSKLFGISTELTYELTRDDPDHVVFSGSNKTATTSDDLSFADKGDGTTSVTYRALVEQGPALGLPPEQHRTDPELAGPALKGLDRHAVSQNDADDLLSDLGL